MAYKERNWECPKEQHLIQVDIGEVASTEEEFWWSAILCSGNYWNATTKYNGFVEYHASPTRFRNRSQIFITFFVYTTVSTLSAQSRFLEYSTFHF
ncbi:hypothetical protein FE257_008813 [Aspergillus nanangensis]|uniref:Uncharacterized protein n=1 Tax=Aspergillus nanangensis TaxID=2582783 RepID=A0AAD4CKK6_ASPNN|nr:hypothetical protein FE257_008813 [Aspergillus nanangensis]